MATWTNKCYCCSAKYNSLSATLDRNWDKHPTHTFSVLKPFFNEEKIVYMYMDQTHFDYQSPQALSGTADSETSIVVTPWRVLGGAAIHIQVHRWYGDPVQVHVLF